MILLLDNYDSFAHNLARYLRLLGAEVRVVRNDAARPDTIAEWKPQAIVFSPGPCTPNEAGFSLEIVAQWQGIVPMLGICLGHQTIVQALGGRIVRASRPVHGVASEVYHQGASIFCGLPSPLRAGRYHSLVADRQTLPGTLRVTAWLADGEIMAVADDHDMLVGLQFHPESILTACGIDLLARFLNRHGISLSATSSDSATRSALQTLANGNRAGTMQMRIGL